LASSSSRLQPANPFSRCHDGCHVTTLPERSVDLLAPRRALLPLVIPAGQDDKQLALQLVNQAMFLIDASLVQPISGPGHHIVGADVDRNEFLVFNQ
jgi:hypothetical protein